MSTDSLGVQLILSGLTVIAVSLLLNHFSSNSKLRDKKASRIRSWIDGWVHGGSIPNAVIGVRHRGSEVFFHATGYADVENKIPVKRDTIFRIYSMTKPCTTVAVLMLQERGLLDVNDPVEKYLEEFKNIEVYVSGTTEQDLKSVPLKEPLRLQHLLTHTSGVNYAFLTAHACGKILSEKVPNHDAANLFCNTPMDALSKYIASVPLCFQPGSAFLYGLNTDLLGLIVERVSGKPFSLFLKEELFEPLGMKDTDFSIPADQGHRLSACYEVNSAHGLKLSVGQERERVQPKAPHTLVSGGGGLVSTIDDYLTFAQFLLNEGVHRGRRLLKASSVIAMRTNHLPPETDLAAFGFDKSFSETVGSGYGFGYGVSVIKDPTLVPGGALSAVGEYGWGGIASTSFFIDPANDLAVVFLTQLIPSRAYPLRPQLKWLTHWLCRDDLSEDSSIH